MKTFTISTLGCKVNQYESSQIHQLLADQGLRYVATPGDADLVVVNTCCITHTASAKSRQSIRKAGKLNPRAVVVVAGCLPASPLDEWKHIAGNVHFVTRKADLSDMLHGLVAAGCSSDPATPSNKAFFEAKIKDKTSRSEDTPSLLPPLETFSGQNRAFLKVQDGCDAFCSYCIIPHIRTFVCNKSVKSVLDEAYALVAAGHKEIILTGIFLGAYGQTTARRRHWDAQRRDALADLLDQVARVPGLHRVRLSSLEPADVTDRLLDVFCAHPNIAPHLHLPLQSGSERILKRMCRQYRLDDFRASVDKVTSRLDRPAITTDIIVGFPGETEDDFAASLDIMHEVAFAQTHVFPFSARKGTAAARMTPHVPAAVIRERVRILLEADSQLQQRFRDRFRGETATLVVESLTPPRGRCERYFMVELHNHGQLELGQLVTTTIA
ncbi:MAG: tRNA (N(6)-L-threonylcarbamoyladenosine(37)-C(2))-methylthiotransferase MtaB [Phycisphaerae bacterium]|nr:tRNA (N(6)-L-threonylcarbamoyladenosine(37)-C(2))-methylthiotransferase MtaB [Phycisphaerae bacterium]